MTNKSRYYLDTDMGNDDILAIAMLLSQNLNLRGISTVFGVATVKQGTRNLGRILAYLQKNIPVYQGCRKSLTTNWNASFPPIDCVRANQLTLLKNLPLANYKSSSTQNLDQLAQKIVEEPSPINFVAIGPLTNVATMIQKYGSAFTQNISSLTVMGDALTVPGIVPPANLVEYNIYLDPVAAKTVFKSGIQITLIPIDATRFVPASNNLVTRAKQILPTSKVGKIIKSLIINNQGDFNSYYDPLLASYLINPAIATSIQLGDISITTKGGNIGQTKIYLNPNSNTQVVMSASPEKFNTLLLSCIGRNKTLIMSCTHGNEGFSIPVVQKISSAFSVDYLLGNPRALKQNTRFTDTDLNRSEPGSVKSLSYEERRAKQIISQASKYQATIDIHGTVSNSGIFLILSDPNWQNIELAKKFDVQNVVMWPGLLPTGPLSQFIPNCLEVECGPKDSPAIPVELERILRSFLSGETRQIKQNFYIVTGQIKGEYDSSLQDFVETRKYGDPFYPLLCGNQYSGIACYQMQKMVDTL